MIGWPKIRPIAAPSAAPTPAPFIPFCSSIVMLSQKNPIRPPANAPSFAPSNGLPNIPPSTPPSTAPIPAPIKAFFRLVTISSLKNLKSGFSKPTGISTEGISIPSK